MNAVVYLCQVSACMGIFYLFYYALLRRFTFFTINRWYLLITMVMCFVIPLLTITVQRHQSYPAIIQKVVYVNQLQSIPEPVVLANTTPIERPKLYWLDFVKLFYMLSVTGLSVRLFIVVIRFFSKVRNKKRTSIGGVKIVRGDNSLNNGSFFNYIFLNSDELTTDEMQQIIIHEMLHVKLFHSVDRVLSKIVQIFLWFNPFAYLYARAIEENHEFEVDRAVGNSTDKNKYAELLLHLSVASGGTLFHNFSMVPLKKRITMLFTKPTHKMKKVVYLLIVPVVLISCLAFARIKLDNMIKVDMQDVNRKIVNAVKTVQEDVAKTLNPSVKFQSINSTVDRSNTINRSMQVPVLKDTAVEYSDLVGPGSTPFSKNAIVKIDGKIYPTSILNEISGRNVTTLSLNGTTGEVNITTKNGDGQVTYLTAHEKANIYKERAIPRADLFIRIPLTRENGDRYDYVSIGTKYQTVRAARIAPSDKVGFLVDNTLYDEDGFKKLPREIISSINGFGFPKFTEDTLYYDKYKVLYILKTNDYWQKFTGSSPLDRVYPENTITRKPDTSWVNDIVRNRTALFAKSQSTDTLQFNARAYKVSANAVLIDIIKQLPVITAKSDEVFVGKKKIASLFINNARYNGNVLTGLKSFPASIVSDIQIIGADDNNERPVIINIITRPK